MLDLVPGRLPYGRKGKEKGGEGRLRIIIIIIIGTHIHTLMRPAGYYLRINRMAREAKWMDG